MAIISNGTTIADAGAFSASLGSMVHIKTLTADGLISGRVVHAGTNGVLSDAADLTFSGDTLTANKLSLTTNASIAVNTTNDRVLVWDSDDSGKIKMFEKFTKFRQISTIFNIFWRCFVWKI